MSDVLDKIRERWDFRSNYLIDLLSKADFAQLFEGSFEEKFKKGEVVVRKNHVPEYVYFIKEGSVKRYAKDSHDKEYIIQILRKNLFFGYHSILSEERFSSYTETLEESVIVLIPKNTFLSFLKTHPNFQMNLLKILSYEFSFLINYISNYINKPVINRVAIQLLLQATYLINFNHIDENEIKVKIKRDDLAALVGASRENIILALSKLKHLNYIKIQGSNITIIDINKLIEYND